MLNSSYLTESENNSTYILLPLCPQCIFIFYYFVILVVANEYTGARLDFSVSIQASKG